MAPLRRSGRPNSVPPPASFSPGGGVLLERWFSGRPLLGGGVQARAADALDRDEVASVRERTAANLALDRLKTIDRGPPDVHATLLSGGWIQRLAPQIGHREGALSTAIPYLQLAHTRSSQCRGIALSLFVFVVMF
jgi:hypothetical protein